MNQDITDQNNRHTPWNKGKLIGQKFPLKLKEIWAFRICLQMANSIRELALFNLAIDSKLRGCDLVKLRVGDIAQSNRVSSRAIIMQQKTHRPVQFEITEQTRVSKSVENLPLFSAVFPINKNSGYIKNNKIVISNWQIFHALLQCGGRNAFPSAPTTRTAAALSLMSASRCPA